MPSISRTNDARQRVPQCEAATVRRSSETKKVVADEGEVSSTRERTYGVPSDYVTIEMQERGSVAEPRGAGFLRFDDRPRECFFSGAWGTADVGALLDKMKSWGGCDTFTAYAPHLSDEQAQSLEEQGFVLRNDGVMLRQDPDGPTPPRVERAGETTREEKTVDDLTMKTTTEREVQFGRPVVTRAHAFTREGKPVGETTTVMLEDARQCYLGTLEVTGERGKGDGTKILSVTEKALKRDGCVEMWWIRSSFGTRPIDNEALGRWYTKRGGIREGDTDTFHKPL